MTVKVLLDECLPKKLKYRIEELNTNFQVETTPEMGWASYSNGELLKLAEEKFDVFITSDKNLSFQQAVTSKSIQIILLKAISNTYKDLLPLIKKSKLVIEEYKHGQFSIIE